MSAQAGVRVAGAMPTEAIREQFPSLARRHKRHPVAYLDGPGGTQVPRVVVDRMSEYLFHHNANTHWKYPTSAETDAMILESRQALADFLNGSPDEIAFGANMTTLTFHLSRALGRGWKAGDEIVVTELDHHANVAPWRALEKERGARIVTVRMRASDGTLDMDDLARALGPRTKLLAIGAASNALGTITDVKAATALARERAPGALVFVDAVHYAPHALVDVRDIGCDFLACSAYKFYGPHIGVLWGKRQLLEGLDVPKLDPAPNEAPERLETGTQNHEGIVGAAAAVDFLASISEMEGPRRDRLVHAFAATHARGEELLRQLHGGLSAIRGVTIHGRRPGEPRTPTIAFTLAGRHTDDVAVALADRGLFCSHGDFYAATVIERLGVGEAGVVRVGCSVYTTDEEIARVVETVRSIAP
ncbi:MAG TPA: cysteine desulfurase-like protein [Gemmatimonadaceae bacterium]|nr:cysteine desulfurase-like protein [Gemmatimonadaceae bacterium]